MILAHLNREQAGKFKKLRNFARFKKHDGMLLKQAQYPPLIWDGAQMVDGVRYIPLRFIKGGSLTLQIIHLVAGAVSRNRFCSSSRNSV